MKNNGSKATKIVDQLLGEQAEPDYTALVSYEGGPNAQANEAIESLVQKYSGEVVDKDDGSEEGGDDCCEIEVTFPSTNGYTAFKNNLLKWSRQTGFKGDFKFTSGFDV